MPIGTLLVDNLIACTQLNAKLVPGLAAPANVGPIKSDVGLDKIAEHVAVSNLKPKETDNTSHARPTMLAGISSFAEHVKAAWDALGDGAAPGAFDALSANAKQDFAQWEGMIAAVALCNIYSGNGLSLSVNTVKLAADGNAAMGCVVQELKNDAVYKAAVDGNQGQLFYICQKGVPFAIFHPDVGLCPMQEYDDRIFDGVLPWHKSVPGDCHGGWHSILTLDIFCLSRVAAWARANGFTTYADYLVKKNGPFPELAPGLFVEKSVKDAFAIDAVWTGKGTSFGKAAMAYLDAEGKPHPMPDLFLDKLMITGTGGGANNKMVYNTAAGERKICFLGDNGVLAEFAPVPPFKGSIMDILAQCPLSDLIFTARLNGLNQLEAVEVAVTFNTPTGALTMRKTYGYEALRLGQLPYLMLWPFVPMPAGMDLWKSYYATWHPQTDALKPLSGADGKYLSIVDTAMGYSWGSQGTVHTVFRPTAADQDWPVCVGSQPFRYAVLTAMEAGASTEELGLVFMPSYPMFAPTDGTAVGTAPVKVAVDFGTTSTVCALSSSLFPGGKTEITLPFRDYSRCVTCESENARRAVSTMRWLGNKEHGDGWKWDRKLFSVAQLFERKPAYINHKILGDASKQDYYVDGRLFLTSGDMLAALAAVGGKDPLLAQQIMNDMKFNHTLDIKNHQAASIYLAGVYLYAVLYLLSNKIIPSPGVDFVELLVSYPNDVTLGALKQDWGFAQTILSKLVSPLLTSPISTLLVTPSHFYNEATAATAYQRRPGAPIAFVGDLVSLDIGGGTSDISISNTLRPGDVRNLSVRFAGREIMVSSLVELYRKVNPEEPAIVSDASFSNLWSHDPQSATLCTHFNKLCTPNEEGGGIPFLHGLTNNSTLRMSVEMLLAQNMTLGDANDLNPTNLLRQLISMKFLMLLRVVAKAVRKNIDMWKDPTTGNLTLVANQLQINLSVSGTGAQLLQYVFNCTMGDLVLLQTPHLLPPDSTMAKCMNLMNTVFYEELKEDLGEGNYTTLKIYVDPNVAQKLDVSYGMLQPDIDKYVPAKPVAPAAAIPGFPATVATPAVGTAIKDAQKAAMQEHINGSYTLESLKRYIDGVKDADGATQEHGIMDYWKWYEAIFPTPTINNRGLGKDVNTMSSLMEKASYVHHFAAAKMAVAAERPAFLIEPEHAAYLDDLIGMYMVEELLDWLIASHQ